MPEEAEYFNKQGLRHKSIGQYQQAIEFFTKAIEIDPQFAEAYRHRGQVLQAINRPVESDNDIQMYKKLCSGKSTGNINGTDQTDKPKPAKLNWQDIEDIYEAVSSIDYEDTEDESLPPYDSYDHDITDRSSRNIPGSQQKPDLSPSNTHDIPVTLELVNGKTIEVESARLFEPTDNDISIVRHDGHVERVIPLEHIACIRITEPPQESDRNNASLSHTEIIEAADGKTYHVAIPPDQERENTLFGYSCREQESDFCKYIPVVNIRKRCLKCYLGEILLEKGFIDNETLTKALEEHQRAKNIKLGKIIAQKSEIAYSVIEEELNQTKQASYHDALKAGEILLASGLVDSEQILDALQHQEYMKNMKIGQFLIEKGFVQEEEVYIALAEKFRIPFVDLRKLKVAKSTLELLSRKFIKQNAILPIILDNDILTVATLRPDASSLREDIVKESKCKDVRLVITQPSHLNLIIERLTEEL